MPHDHLILLLQDQETDQVTPLRKASSKHLDPDERKPRFSVSSEMMDTLHRPVDIVMNTIRKITSHENIEGLRRNQSHVSFRDVDPQADERRPKFSIAGGRMGHRASFDSHISMEDVKHDLAERATELQRGISYPAFDIVNMVRKHITAFWNATIKKKSGALAEVVTAANPNDE